MPWADRANAMLQMWYPGQEGGTATAELLLGQANPSGKLQVTFPKAEADTPVAGHPERFPGLSIGTTAPSSSIRRGSSWAIAGTTPMAFSLCFRSVMACLTRGSNTPI